MAYIIMSYAEIKKTINSDFSTPLNEGGVKIVKSVQRGFGTASITGSISGSTIDLTIGSVNPSKCIVIASAIYRNYNYPVGIVSFSETQLKITINPIYQSDSTSSTYHISYSWQVIEFY